MTLAKLWERRQRKQQSNGVAMALSMIKDRQAIEWEHNGRLHIFAMTFPDGWAPWCMIKPGGAYRIGVDSGRPAEEATIAPFRTSFITCSSCLYMWKLVCKRADRGGFEKSFLWEPFE